jgi:MGT family glycosyltransferase
MAKFLLTVWPFASHLHPNIALAHALRERGHEVTFYTGSTARPTVEGAGFRCFPFQRVDEDRVGQVVESIMSRRHQIFQSKALWHEFLLLTVSSQLGDLEAVLAATPPDVIVSDIAMWGPILVLHETWDGPVAAFSHVAHCLVPGRDGSIGGLPFPRPRNRWTPLYARLIRMVSDFFTADVRRAASKLRQAYGLSSIDVSVREFAGRMPLYLVPSTPEFDYERCDLPPSVHYVGPCLWDKPKDGPPPAWLGRIRRDLPCVFVTEGTLHAREPVVLWEAAQALANLPMQVIMTTGERRAPSELGLEPIAPNVRVEQWVAPSDLLPVADLVVTTGNSDIVLAALSAGVPLIVVPTIWDQSSNARRVVDKGVGLRLAVRYCTPQRLRATVKRVLEEPSFRQNAERLAVVFARYGGPTRAAELLEGLSAGHPVSRGGTV